MWEVVNTEEALSVPAESRLMSTDSENLGALMEEGLLSASMNRSTNFQGGPYPVPELDHHKESGGKDDDNEDEDNDDDDNEDKDDEDDHKKDDNNNEEDEESLIKEGIISNTQLYKENRKEEDNDLEKTSD